MLLTPRQREVLEAYVTHGGAKGAATVLSERWGQRVTEAAIVSVLKRMREQTGLTTAQLIARGAREGWLKEAA